MQDQGEKHLIWDAIIEEENNSRPYLDYILDKELVIYSSRQALTVAREKINKKKIEYANNSIDLLKCLLENDIKKENIKDMISIMTHARKVINKHHHIDMVQEKV